MKIEIHLSPTPIRHRNTCLACGVAMGIVALASGLLLGRGRAAVTSAAPFARESQGAAFAASDFPAVPAGDDVTPITDRILLVRLVDGRVLHETPYGTRNTEKPGAHGSDFHTEVDGKLEVTPLDVLRAGNTGSYRITSADDSRYANEGRAPKSVGRKSRGVDGTMIGEWQGGEVVGHWVYLELPEALHHGKTYTVELAEDLARWTRSHARRYTFVYDEARRFSETVKVNQIGYAPDGPKYGYLFHWMGDRGALNLDDHAGNTRFHVLDARTRKAVFEGRPTLRQRNGEGNKGEVNARDSEDGVDYEGSDVWQCDFSALKTPGTYILEVDGIGCSFPFRIDSDVYRVAFYTTVRGVYHQRCGTALRQPFTQWTYPVCHDPNSPGSGNFGKPMLQTNIPKDTAGFGDGFDALGEGRTTGETRNIAGGWHDAMDWDREGGHPEVVFDLCWAYELAPKNFADGELNLPESGNGIPDILDEARWGVDYWRRLQRSTGHPNAGGVSIGLFQGTYPRRGMVPWQDPMAWYLYTEDPSTTYRYTQAAAMLAYDLRLAGKPGLAAGYVDSARRAWTWAEAHYRQGDAEMRGLRLGAAAALYRVTGDPACHRAFRSEIHPTEGPMETQSYRPDQAWGSWIYLRTDLPDVDRTIQTQLRATNINWIDTNIVAVQDGRACRGPERWRTATNNSHLTAPSEFRALMLADALTHDPKYRRALLAGMDTILGCNPLNMTFITGLGSRSPGGLAYAFGYYQHGGEMPPGLIPLGPVASDAEVEKTFYPSYGQWPGALEKWVDGTSFPGLGEPVVANSARVGAAMGYLCAPARRRTLPPTVPLDGLGLTGDYFRDGDLKTRVCTQLDRCVDFFWGTSAPDPRFTSESFSARWSGFVVPERRDNYTFSVRGGGAARLWINNRLVLDRPADAVAGASSASTVPVTLEAGHEYALRLEYRKPADLATEKFTGVRLSWSGRETLLEVVPHRLLRPVGKGNATGP